ncbi:MAG: hypothetical protein HRF49_11850 [bacterium]|jgi:hypothetical protein
MGEVKDESGMQFSFEFKPEPEFDARMPEQFFVRAMHSNKGVFLSREFLKMAESLDANEVAGHLMEDLNRESEGEINPVLMLYYLFTDFKEEFPRMMLMKGGSAKKEEGS